MTKPPKAHDNLHSVYKILQRNDTFNMINVPITLSATVTLNTQPKPVSVSIPFKNAQIFNVNALALVNEELQVIDCQIEVLTHWPDKSLKWVRIHFTFTGGDNNSSVVYLKDATTLLSKANNKTVQDNSLCVQENSECFYITTGNASFQLNKDELGVFSANFPVPEAGISATTSNKNLHVSQKNSLLLTDKGDLQYHPKIEKISFSDQQASNQPLQQLTAYISGSFQAYEEKSVTKFTAEITFYLNQSYTKWHISLHNPNSMIHSGGTWDLGNENSLYFKSFNAVLDCLNDNVGEYKIDDSYCHNQRPQEAEAATWQTACDELLIFQVSSGGDNWQSKNHVNCQGVVTLEFNGYQISANNSTETIQGRAAPTIHIPAVEHSSSGASVYIKDFWQKFPKSIAISSNKVVLGLFAEQAVDGFELQPGERKSDVFYINYGDNKNSLAHVEAPINASVSAEYIASCQAVPFFTANATEENDQESEYQAIIADGLHAKNNFFHKRELIDEFGWRNFGDIYADHETLECDYDGELISHYNNQYDPLYGLLRQYLLTNDSQWLTLANDLADHVVNIDIYHSNQDKAEYNGGLFWHTDHYLPAETASHRTYSKLQKNDAYQDHAGGGGPGGQHCYTTGLMLHYFITGQQTSKQAVLQLSDWITHVYEGSGTLTDFLLAIKNKKRIDVKNVFTGKYPLDRGTGHYILALIDSFELTGKQSYLDKASLIIKNTVHPEDDISARNLTNVEECWFYTIFFQAVYRYLHVKQNIEQLDRSFQYARASLLHYAKWMCEHEQPYLNTPEILEYPNHTWAAQDIRKANVLYMASYFADSAPMKEQCKAKADGLYKYVVKTFSNEPTRSFTRILSILMQNHGVKSYVENNWAFFPSKDMNISESYTNSKGDQRSENKNLLDAFVTTLSNTSLSNELTWLRKRSKSVDDFFAKLGK